MESAGATTIASGLADWAGSPTRYRYTGPGGAEISEEVPWQGHTQAVQRFVYDLTHTEPIAVRDRADLAAVGHRVVHGGAFTSSVRITPELRSRIAALADLAPLHNPPGLEALRGRGVRAAGRAARGGVRYGISRHVTARSVHLPAAATLGAATGASAASASTG